MKFNIGDRVKVNAPCASVNCILIYEKNNTWFGALDESGVNGNLILPIHSHMEMELIERCPPEERPIKDLLKAMKRHDHNKLIIEQTGGVEHGEDGYYYLEGYLKIFDEITLSDQTKKDIEDNPEAVLEVLKNSNPQLFK